MGRPKGITMVTFLCDGCNSYGTKKRTDYERAIKNYCTLECYKANGCSGQSHRNIKRTTYICENPKCDVEITESQKVYDKKKYHYCTLECKKSHTKDIVEIRRIASLRPRVIKEKPTPCAKKLAKKTFNERWNQLWEEAV